MKTQSIILFCCFLLICKSTELIGQFNFNIEQCADSMEVITLVDTCFLSHLDPGSYKNIEFHGDPVSVGYFSNGYIFGFSNPYGIVISTGYSSDLDGSNSCSGQYASGNTAGWTDPDLVQLSNSTIMDACIIEFDYLAYGDSVELEYVFGSEEYHEYVGFPFNDVMGIFLSGPGITGSFSNNATNISLVPQTILNVSIPNINCGTQTSYCTPPPGGPNCELLYDNTDQSNGSFTQTPLNAYTVPLFAKRGIIDEQWYHIKIAIGDAGDWAFDSGLFLEKGSFQCGFYTDNDTGKLKGNIDLDIGIMPNPTKNLVNLVVNTPEILIFEVLIFNQLGVQEYNQKFNHYGGQNTYKIEIPNLNPGIHFVKVLTSSGMTRLLKLEVVN